MLANFGRGCGERYKLPVHPLEGGKHGAVAAEAQDEPPARAAVYSKYFPKAKLLGLDHSESAISLCREKHGEIAEFISGDVNKVPNVDIIIASNVMERISNDESIIAHLLTKCLELYVFVPYKEKPLCSEHVNYYDETSYSRFVPLETKVFFSKGWSQYGINLLIDVYLKNLVRPFIGRPLVRRKKQIMFQMKGSIPHR